MDLSFHFPFTPEKEKLTVSFEFTCTQLVVESVVETKVSQIDT